MIYAQRRTQTGFTLLEAIAGIAIAVTMITVGLAAFGTASSDASSYQSQSDLEQIITSTQTFYKNQPTRYGTGVLNQALSTANKLPKDLTYDSTTGNINTPGGGTITVTGNTNTFTIGETNLGADQCSQLLANMSQNLASVQVGTGSAISPLPVSPTVATNSSNCGGTGPFTVTWTSSN